MSQCLGWDWWDCFGELGVSKVLELFQMTHLRYMLVHTLNILSAVSLPATVRFPGLLVLEMEIVLMRMDNAE